MRIGDRVQGPHGPGTIVGRNHQGVVQEPEYRGRNEPEDAPLRTLACSLALMGAYDGHRYPHVVLFDDGYRDVYGPTEISLLPALGRV